MLGRLQDDPQTHSATKIDIKNLFKGHRSPVATATLLFDAHADPQQGELAAYEATATAVASTFRLMASLGSRQEQYSKPSKISAYYELARLLKQDQLPVTTVQKTKEGQTRHTVGLSTYPGKGTNIIYTSLETAADEPISIFQFGQFDSQYEVGYFLLNFKSNLRLRAPFDELTGNVCALMASYVALNVFPMKIGGPLQEANNVDANRTNAIAVTQEQILNTYNRVLQPSGPVL